jgi:phosphopentomutase
VYPHGFPDEVISEFVKRIGRRIIGNKVASGTEIIKELGAEHVKTGFPIVYTSADSVFQVAAHEEVIPVPELYRMCETARALLVGEHGVGRVIARPFTGTPGNFARTGHRKDFSLVPPGATLLDSVSRAGSPVFGIGKIEDIFAGRGLTGSNHTTNNRDGLDATLGWMKSADRGLAFVNLVDFDMVYGHRNDTAGYAKALQEFDSYLPRLIGAMRQDDLLIVTADHGCDPTTPSTDHSREYVPLFALGARVRPAVDLGVRDTFADVGATAAEWLGTEASDAGKSFLGEIL